MTIDCTTIDWRGASMDSSMTLQAATMARRHG
jgi:hypothetical protein